MQFKGMLRKSYVSPSYNRIAEYNNMAVVGGGGTGGTGVALVGQPQRKTQGVKLRCVCVWWWWWWGEGGQAQH